MLKKWNSSLCQKLTNEKENKFKKLFKNKKGELSKNSKKKDNLNKNQDKKE